MTTAAEPFIWLAFANVALGAIGVCFSRHITCSRRRAHLSAAALVAWVFGTGAVALGSSGLAEWLIGAARILAQLAIGGVANAT